jgi:spore coat protein CotH
MLKKTAFIVTVVILITALFPACSSQKLTSSSESTTSGSPDYVEKIFGSEIISLDILADPDKWQTMLDNATAEEYIKVDVVVNGTTFTNVGIRPKGNSSLMQVAQSTSDRFSFRLKFDEYVDGQTCFGLDTFVINNMFGDNTYLKEYISYDLMRTIGVDCPYYNFADVKLNSELWGFYLAVEAYNDSYELRENGDDSGILYNVKTGMDNMGGNNLPNGQRGGFPGDQTQNNPGRGMGAANDGGSLIYTDDNSESYSAIFANAVGTVSDEDEQAVIAALKALSTGTGLEQSFDVDAILRYLAAHTLVVNQDLDSYSSNMAQNYYIYEYNGQLTILPWDYNLAWGGFENSLASDVVNFPIDTPVSGVSMADRPLLNQLLSDSDYLAKYHDYLQILIDQYFDNGKFAAKIVALRGLIDDYVKNDPSAFCTYADFEKAVTAFSQLGDLRAQSVQGQLDGYIPATTAGQQAEPGKLVNAEKIDLKDLGGMGRGQGQDQGQIRPGRR